MSYRGRFAPSPTGPLHMGSLIAALASYLDAKLQRGQWLVRIDDLDPPREILGAAQSILNSLIAHGLHWDEEVQWQSKRSDAYEAALKKLASGGETFACSCSRPELHPRGYCQKDCHNQAGQLSIPHATRLRVRPGTTIVFSDTLQGKQQVDLAGELHDFAVKRKDGLYAYQLAVVVDDASLGITHIVRGSDLLDSTPRQIYLQQVLNLPTPAYTHIPVITNSQGQKFSKQNHAPGLIDQQAAVNLRYALQFLQQPPPSLELTDPESILASAVQHWSLTHVPHIAARPENPGDPEH